jgi:hypothetical protein
MSTRMPDASEYLGMTVADPHCAPSFVTGAVSRRKSSMSRALQMMKRVVRRIAPSTFERISAARNTSRLQQLAGIRAKMIDRYGRKICGGPFTGVIYVPDAEAVLLPAKHIGAYEAELHDAIERIVRNGYRTIVDVGCAEGYYAIGLAVRIPAARMYAFDTDPNGQNWCRQMAAANGAADRVEVGAACDHARLNALPLEGGLIFSDCEGYELELLDPQRVPALARCDLLVELHDEQIPGSGDELIARFRPTHEITVIHQQARNVEQYPMVKFLPAAESLVAISDCRGEGSRWAFMVRRTTNQKMNQETTS